MNEQPPLRRGRFDRRALILGAVWLLVALRVGSELTGRGAPFWHHDLRMLYREVGSFYHGIYPAAEVSAQAKGAEAVRSDYPPFSFPLMIPWIPPGMGWRAVGFWFAGCQIAAAGVVIGWAWRRGRAAGKGAGWLLAGAILAMTGLRADLLYGNYGVVMTALLVGLLVAVERDDWIGAGAAWVGSVLKPQMGWLFAIVFLGRQGWRALMGAGAALVALALGACWWTGVTPLDVVRSSYAGRVTTMALQAERHNLVSLLGEFGLAPGGAVMVAAILGLAAAGATLRGRLGAADVATKFAFLGLVNRICAYHNACDDLLTVFALVHLGRRAWRENSALGWSAFLLLGGIVWVPTAMSQWRGANAVMVVGWAAVAAWVWLRAEPDAESKKQRAVGTGSRSVSATGAF